MILIISIVDLSFWPIGSVPLYFRKRIHFVILLVLMYFTEY